MDGCDRLINTCTSFTDSDLNILQEKIANVPRRLSTDIGAKGQGDSVATTEIAKQRHPSPLTETVVHLLDVIVAAGPPFCEIAFLHEMGKVLVPRQTANVEVGVG
jgi:hypothetical protein